MIGDFSIPSTPDGLSGVVFACEGVKGALTLLNGPTGCKYYHSAISDDQMLRSNDYDPLRHQGVWFFGQPRVPCTYLDSDDYVFGSRDKLEDALRFVSEKHSPKLIAVVNSPGAALIGDDIEAIAKATLPDVHIIAFDSPGFSNGVWAGFDAACRKVVEYFLDRAGDNEAGCAPGAPVACAEPDDRPCVNLLGMSVFHKYQEGSRSELERALGLAGIRVNCAPCCSSGTDELARVGQADLNIVVDAAYGMETARFLEKRCGTPYLRLEGVPVGFAAVEEMVSKASEVLGTDPAPAIRRSEKARVRSYKHLSRLNSLTGLPKAVPFAVTGTASEVLGYCKFLIEYYAMVAQSATVFDGKDSEEYARLVELLESHGQQDALDVPLMQTRAHLVFSDGNGISQLKLKGREFTGIEIALPQLGYTDVVPKTHFGARGGLLMTEMVYNGMLF